LRLPCPLAVVALFSIRVFASSKAAAGSEDSIRADGGAADTGSNDATADLSGLIGSLDLRDANARRTASEAAERLGEHATPTLIRAAHSPSREVARWAAGELETLGRKIPGDAVQTKSNQVLAGVLLAYGDTRDADALGAVLSFVNSDRTEVRDAARRAVLAYGDAALPKLREAYTNLMGRPPPDAWIAADLARELFASDDGFRQKDVYALMDEGLADEAASRHEEAVTAFEKVLARQPLFERRVEMVTAFVLAAQSKEDNDEAEAEAYYRIAERLSPGGPRAGQARSGLLYLEGEKLLARGITDESLFQRAGNEDPGNLKAHAELARIESRKADRDLKVRHYAEGGLAAAALFAGLALLPRPKRVRTP
jgi:hypothetical protein